jgi:hypothetical protein
LANSPVNKSIALKLGLFDVVQICNFCDGHSMALVTSASGRAVTAIALDLTPLASGAALASTV